MSDRFFSVDTAGTAEAVSLPITIDEDRILWPKKGRYHLLPEGTKRVTHGHYSYTIDFPQSRILDVSSRSWHQSNEPVTFQKAAEFIITREIK